MLHPVPSIRVRAALLLLGFTLAIVLGALGHPVGDDLHHHACDGTLAHLDADSGHDHDPAACAGCHLFQSLSQSTAVAPPALLAPAPALVGQDARAPARVLTSQHTRSFDARGPPAA